MKREWKAGDVGEGVADEGRMFYVSPGRWVFDDGTHSIPTVDYEARPLVVIDPDDREQVREVLSAFGRQYTAWSPELDRTVTLLQAAFREIADPTQSRPDEPTGLGAVVEDADGNKWTLCRIDNASGWVRFDGKGFWRMYADLEAVRVLSEGVTA